MKSHKLYFLAMIIPIALITSSCSSNSTKADEPEVATMDSVSKELSSSNDSLDAQTKKLEASLEAAEELETTN
jgi:beta-lactamase regulating signal transducer with metallopeptidase domain